MPDEICSTIRCVACNDVGWVPFRDGYAPCQSCEEMRRAQTTRVLNAGGTVGISIGMDGSITRRVKEKGA